MKNKATKKFQYKSHPWHGINPGNDPEDHLRCYIEVVPGDEMKYEIDKESGYLIVDRPNKYSNTMPVLYGFVPQTYCAEEVANYCMKQSGKTNILGDGDPLDICILTDRHIPRGDLLVECIPVGGFRMIDQGEADDKIVAVLKGDHTYGHFKDISDCPEALIKRIKHYFLTYKEDPDISNEQNVLITNTYGRKEALEIVACSFLDYKNHYED
jgi:inorganic pyrophosphatase